MGYVCSLSICLIFLHMYTYRCTKNHYFYNLARQTHKIKTPSWRRERKKNQAKYSSWGIPSSGTKWKKSSLPTKKSLTTPLKSTYRKWGKPTEKKVETMNTPTPMITKNVSQVSATTWNNYGFYEKVYSQVSFDRSFFLQRIFIF